MMCILHQDLYHLKISMVYFHSQFRIFSQLCREGRKYVMEYIFKKTRSKSIYVPSQEEKFIRKIDYDTPQKSLHLDLEIFQKEPHESIRTSSHKVLVSVKPRTPAIKTLYVAEQKSFVSERLPNTGRPGTHLAKGDCKSDQANFRNAVADIIKTPRNSHGHKSDKCSVEESSSSFQNTEPSRATDTQCLLLHINHDKNQYDAPKKITEQCYRYSQNLALKSQTKTKHETFQSNKRCQHNTFLKTSSEDSFESNTTLHPSHRRKDHLGKKSLLRDMDTDLSSSDDICDNTNMKSTSETARAGCSYIEHYSHVPDTSAFQRFQQEEVLSQSRPQKTSTIEKEHNSEQYGRDFTAFDSISARGRRHSASVPLHHRERYDSHRGAAERVHKIRHKLNPVRDYRLMDTVHYLAQGEFAPRDDGIKLTPSREAVLSDIIWEDVCRTHWPNTRLASGRRPQHHDRRTSRNELQRLIDSLLRERVSHVERRRRRHYRIVKLNHRRESRTNPLGKTDVIVASHKSRNENNPKSSNSVHKASNSADERLIEKNCSRRRNRSYDGLSLQEPHGHFRTDNCLPGPSYISAKCPENFKTTCCYHTYRPDNAQAPGRAPRQPSDVTSSNDCRPTPRTDHILVTKERRHKRRKEETNLNQYILLPTLVMRTPSNLKRQKKFNDLYHRVLKTNLEADSKPLNISQKKNIGLNVHITLSDKNDNIQ